MSLITCRADPRYVGDPVDVVTGAATDTPVDLIQRGPIPLQWVRYYSSARSHIHGSLGWGHSHGFERYLCRDLDGIRYEGPLGDVVGFEEREIGAIQIAGGMRLQRTGQHEFTVSRPGAPEEDFEFVAGCDTAHLVRLRRGPTTVQFTYGTDGALTEIIDSRGQQIHVAYDAKGRVAALIRLGPGADRGGKLLLAYEYDDPGNLVRAVDVYQTTLSFQYDSAHRMTRRTDRRGYSFHFRYDALGRCIHSRGDDGLLEVQLDYHPEAKITFVRRGDGGQWIYRYSDAGIITQVVDPYGNATTYIVDELGRPVQEVDPNGNITQLHYDWLGHHDYRIDPHGYELPTRSDDPNPPDPLAYELPETALALEFGCLVKADEIRPPQLLDAVLAQFPAPITNSVLGRTSSYDVAETPLNDGIPPQEIESYNDFGFPLEYSGPRFTERWKYDPNGNEIEHRDRDGAVFRTTYHSWNAIHERTDPLGNVTTYEQNVEGLAARVTDPGGTTTEYVYDLCDRLVEVRRNGRLRDRYELDAGGNITAKLDGQGRTLVTWEIGPGNVDKIRRLACGEEHVFEYDARGRITSAAAPSGVITFAYTETSKIAADQRDGQGVVHDFRWGRLANTTLFDKFIVKYEADNTGGWIVTDPRGGQHTFQLSPQGLICKKLANGDRELSQYDKLGRCLRKALVRSSPSEPFWMRGYIYSSAGDLIAVGDTLLGETRYEYDGAHRIRTETIASGEVRQFEYDSAGNLLRQPILADVIIGQENQLLAANGAQFQYDDRGRLSASADGSNTTTYYYNELDLLVGCHANGMEWHAAYDAYCRRVSKTWLGQTTRYYWDDFRLAAEVRHDGSLRVYIYPDEVALVPFLFLEYANVDARPESGDRYYVFTNQIGVPIRVEDEVGRTCWAARIDPFGLAHLTSARTIDMPLRFPGHYYDAETGLHYNRFRYFSPELGRYLQSDPIGLVGGVNLYAYPVNPLIGVDVDGLGTKKTRPRRTGSKGEMTPPPGVCPVQFGSMTPQQKTEEWEKYLRQRMGELGVPPSRVGVPDFQQGGKKAFLPQEKKTPGVNIADEGPSGGIAVTGAIFNDKPPPGIPPDKWKAASPADRADAAIIHEHNEMNNRLNNGQWPRYDDPKNPNRVTSDPGHDQAVQDSPNTPQPISDPARDLLQGQKDEANKARGT